MKLCTLISTPAWQKMTEQYEKNGTTVFFEKQYAILYFLYPSFVAVTLMILAQFMRVVQIRELIVCGKMLILDTYSEVVQSMKEHSFFFSDFVLFFFTSITHSRYPAHKLLTIYSAFLNKVPKIRMKLYHTFRGRSITSGHLLFFG